MSADTPSQLRLFVAVPVPASPGLRRVIEALERHRPEVKPVASENLHLTLRFLGDTPAAHVPALAVALDDAAAESGIGVFEMHWARLGRLPREQRKPARVIHVEPADPEPLQKLAAAIEAALTRLELDPPIAPADRPFTAHLTLARIKTPPGRRSKRSRRRGGERTPASASDREGQSAAPADWVETFCREQSAEELGGAEVDAVQLIASRLTPHGPIYSVEHEAPLR